MAAQLNAKLYGTRFCHLCDDAVNILYKIGVAATIIDIVEDDNLFEKYSLRIPVLKRFDNDAELDWPFDAATVSRFLM